MVDRNRYYASRMLSYGGSRSLSLFVSNTLLLLFPYEENQTFPFLPINGTEPLAPSRPDSPYFGRNTDNSGRYPEDGVRRRIGSSEALRRARPWPLPASTAGSP